MAIPRRVILSLLAVILTGVIPAQALAGASLSNVSGIVQVKNAVSDRWDVVKAIPVELANGDSVRTGLKAQAVLTFTDGSRVELGSNSSFILEEASSSQASLRLAFGALKAFVQRVASRQFKVRTPTAVCSVRGTEFRVEVLSGGRTVVDLYKGLLGVEDHRGQQVLLHPNERLQIDLRGMNSPSALPSQSSLQKAQFHALMQREMVLDMSKEQVMAAAVNELKAAEFQQGKSLIDVFGKRVRLEEYIVRPSANQFKLVVLNERQERFDYFYYLGTFNTTLPADLSVALRQLSGSVDAPPAYFLTAFETGRSNTKDSIIEQAQGGHLVDVNNNGALNTSDDVAQFFDAAQNKFVDVAGRSVYQTLFDKYGFYINGGLKYGWSGANIQTYSEATASNVSNTDPMTGAALAPLPTRTLSTTFPDANKLHQVFYESYSDGTFTKWDNYIIDNDGKVASPSDFASATSGAAYKQRLLDFNYEQVITASEFQGRKIDLVMEPKILVQSGLIQ